MSTGVILMCIAATFFKRQVLFAFIKKLSNILVNRALLLEMFQYAQKHLKHLHGRPLRDT